MKHRSLLAFTMVVSIVGSLAAPAAADPEAMYVLDNAGDRLLEISASGDITVAASRAEIRAALSRTSLKFEDSGLTDDGMGNVYFTEARSDSILRYNRHTDTLDVLATGDDLRAATGQSGTSPEGLVYAGHGYLFVQDHAADAILRVDPTTGEVIEWVSKDDFQALGGYVDIEGGIVSRGSRIYTTSDGAPDTLFEIRTNGTPGRLATGFGDLDGSATIAPNGDIIVGDDAGPGGTLYRIAPDGTITTFLSRDDLFDLTGTGSFGMEGGFAFDADGNFYISDSDTGTIYKIDVFGNSSLFAGGSYDFQSALIWTGGPANPEPGTLVLVGAIVGVMAWRRRKRAKATVTETPV